MKNIHPAKLAAIKKHVTKELKKRRGDLEPGKYTLSGSVSFDLDGTVTVGENYDQRVVGKAKPWAMVHVLMTELNAMKDAAGKCGIDLATVAVMADVVDKSLWENAQAKADAAVDAVKATTWTPCNGKVTYKGTVKESKCVE